MPSLAPVFEVFLGDASAAERRALQASQRDLDAFTKAIGEILPASLEAKGARKGSRAAAKIVAEDARKLAPVDTGALEKSLKVRARKRSRRNKGLVGHSVVTGEKTLRGTEFFYGAFRELGTKFQEADPFLRPALYGNQQEVIRAFKEAVMEWVRTTAAKEMQTAGKTDALQKLLALDNQQDHDR